MARNVKTETKANVTLELHFAGLVRNAEGDTLWDAIGKLDRTNFKSKGLLHVKHGPGEAVVTVLPFLLNRLIGANKAARAIFEKRVMVAMK